MKIRKLLLLANILFFEIIFFASSRAQLNVNIVEIAAEHIKISNEYHTLVGLCGTEFNSKDSIDASYFFRASQNFIELSPEMITFSASKTLWYPPPHSNTPSLESNTSIQLELDTLQKLIVHFEGSNETKTYPNEANNQDWVDDIGTFTFDSVTYSITKSKDTLFVKLNGAQLQRMFNIYPRKINIQKYTNVSTTYGGTWFQYSSVLDIPDSAYASIILIGTFPLAVHQIEQNKKSSLIINHLTKTIHLQYATNQNQPLSCYDLLGRKHLLEFLGTDGAGSTYSLRSLAAGVYFVSDGKAMVKFLVGE